jgi:Acyl-CoA carboxylase epsilon subunit
MSAVDGTQAPVITVLRGRPTPVELAAAVAVLAAAAQVSAVPAPAAPAQSSTWAERSRPGAALPRPGAHSWRAPALPR